MHRGITIIIYSVYHINLYYCSITAKYDNTHFYDKKYVVIIPTLQGYNDWDNKYLSHTRVFWYSHYVIFKRELWYTKMKINMHIDGYDIKKYEYSESYDISHFLRSYYLGGKL